MQRFCKEAVAWKHLKHQNIIPLIGATIGENRLSLICEWMDQGDISHYLGLGENLEVNRIELVSRGPLVEKPWLIYVADKRRRRTVIHPSPSCGPRKPKGRMSLLLAVVKDQIGRAHV